MSVDVSPKAAESGHDRAPRVRVLRSADLPAVGDIFREAFNQIYIRRGFEKVVRDPDTGLAIARAYLAHDPEHCLVVESEGVVAGSAFLHPRGNVAGAGPITVAPALQGSGLGSLLVDELCRRSDALGVPSLRLIQDAFNEEAYALYSSRGFVVRTVFARASFRSEGAAKPILSRGARFSDLPRIGSLEQDMLGFARRRDYELLRRLGEIRVLEGRDGLEGWIARMVQGRAAAIGPVLSRSKAGLEQLLLDATSDLAAGTEVRFLLPSGCRVSVPGRVRLHSLCNYMVRGSFAGLAPNYIPTLFPESG
ncbi:MAG: GNAT family N-acetyltransferase [Candidatus Binatia bacterium]|nr:GNAT family N-acetyltransferase [Candidatus Binatia bacterium]MDG2010447.1 GNAT family N-acetyltransferase [Candidatus Binatia bacterium]